MFSSKSINANIVCRASLPTVKQSGLKKKSGRKRKRRRSRLNLIKKNQSPPRPLPPKAQILLQIVLPNLQTAARDLHLQTLSNVQALLTYPKQAVTNPPVRSGRSRRLHPIFKPVCPPLTVLRLDQDLLLFSPRLILPQLDPVECNNAKLLQFVSTLIRQAILPDQIASVLVQALAPVVMVKPTPMAK